MNKANYKAIPTQFALAGSLACIRYRGPPNNARKHDAYIAEHLETKKEEQQETNSSRREQCFGELLSSLAILPSVRSFWK